MTRDIVLIAADSIQQTAAKYGTLTGHVLKSDGSIWFTDPYSTAMGDTRELEHNGVYRLVPAPAVAGGAPEIEECTVDALRSDGLLIRGAEGGADLLLMTSASTDRSISVTSSGRSSMRRTINVISL